MKKIFLVIAVFGAIIPYAFFIMHFQEFGFDLGIFIRHLFVTDAAAGFTADLLISSLVLWILMHNEKRTKHTYFLIAINLFIGLSCALPLYLYLRDDA